jgi:L-alanine-DL-glutamate epimerase-like enolase superfamily enzyme
MPLLLLLPGVTAAQSGSACSIGVELFDGTYGECVESLVPDDPGRAAALKAAQARWDAFAKELGVPTATLWLGPRPKSVSDIWWLPIGG